MIRLAASADADAVLALSAPELAGIAATTLRDLFGQQYIVMAVQTDDATGVVTAVARTQRRRDATGWISGVDFVWILPALSPRTVVEMAQFCVLEAISRGWLAWGDPWEASMDLAVAGVYADFLRTNFAGSQTSSGTWTYLTGTLQKADFGRVLRRI